MQRWRLPRILLVLFLAAMLLPGGKVTAQDDAARDPSFLERRLEALIPGLRVEGLEGALRGAPTADRITLSDQLGVWLTLRDVRLNLARTALLRGVVRLEALEAALLRVDRLPVAAPAAIPTQAGEQPAPGQGGVLPGLPDLPVDLALDRLVVQRLELDPAVLGQAAAFSLTGSAALQSGRLAADLALRRLDREGSITLDLSLAPGEDRLNAQLAVQEPEGGLVPSLLGLPQHPLSLTLSLDGPAAGAALTAAARLGPDIALEAEGTIRALADGAFGAQLRGQLQAAPLLPVPDAGAFFPLRFTLDADRPAEGLLTLTQLQVETPVGQASAAGTLDLAQEVPELTLQLALGDSAPLRALLPPGLAWDSLRGEMRVTGTFAAPQLRLEATPQGLATGIAQADAVLGDSPTLSGTAAPAPRRVDLVVQGAAGRLGVAGSLAAPLDATARLSLPRLEVLGPASSGALEAVARLGGTLADPTITLNASSDRITLAGRVLEGLGLEARIENPTTAPRAQAQLQATLEGLPLELALRGQPQGALLQLDQARLSLGPAVLTATGLIDPDALLFDGSARLEAGALAPLARLAGLAGLEGRLQAQGSFAPRDGVQGFDLRLDAPRLAYAGSAGRIAATVEGTPQAMAWSVQAEAEQGAVSANGRLLAVEQGWRLNLAALRAEALGQAIGLAAPAQIVLGADGGLRLASPLGLTVPHGGRVQLAGRWGPQRADLSATLSSIPAALTGPFLPELSPEGSLSGTVRVTGPVAEPVVEATLRGSGLRPGASWSQGLPALGLRAEARWAAGAARLRAEIEAGRAGRLTLAATLPQGFGPAAPLQASLDGNLALQPLAGPFLAAGADRVTGQLQLALRAEGTLAEPRLGGRATLSGGEYRNPVYGIRISDIAGSVVGAGTRLVVQRLRGRTAGGGSIALQGAVDLGAAGLPAELRLTARDARPAVSDLITAVVDAELRLDGPLLADALLAGQVRIQRAEIRIPRSLPASLPVLDGVQVRGRPPPGAILPPAAQPAEASLPTPQGLPAIRLDVAISAPGRIFVRGRGVDAELGGELRIGGTLPDPVPQGGFELRRGTLQVLARRLTFDRGRIDFAGGTLTPRLDLVARSEAGGTSITIAVQGTPAAPEITFSSSPELPQDEILARLLFDRSTDRLSPFEVLQIAEAIAQLTGVGGGSQALDRLRGALGLDRLGVAGDGAVEGTGAGPTAEAGRYVAPGVYLGLRQGVQSGQTGVGVEVEITPRLKLEGETATGPAGDRLGLTYEFEY
ncbi:translocation/assembly module TamB domain-containing protein [Falsiroseomonas tokyonensis]|uniref:Translocation/assembly module TamB domain-containing protein n=1 Tax=Falsiroseomonas tokyonensis TaxID=430521 RepID=A0ABV7BP58_9PROT|nr:translocation/assembly module TamB domain-containing protein [Falsiroseomonas tokyonensis]MBU8536614.1 translocation/assembly module TamB domain-containing protein [Falsiroseomonas tokyonensis]